MIRPRTRGVAASLGATAGLLAVTAEAVLGVVLWTMTASPLAATVGVETTITLTATNLDPLLGVKCIVADVPAALQPGDAWVVGSSTTAGWVVSRSGQQVTAAIQTGDGNRKLVVGDWVSFAFNALPVQSGTYAINAVAYSGHECVNGARALAAPPVVVISESVAPSLPDSTPSPAPTATPAPIIVVPSILPTLPPGPSEPTPRAGPAVPAPGAAVQAGGGAPAQPAPPPFAAAAAALSSVEPTQAPAQSAVASGGQPAPVRGEARPLGLTRAEPDEGLGLALGQFGVIDGLGVWAIPGAVVGGPGVIVILWVAIQAGAALAWVPAVRRLRGDSRFGRRVTRT